MLWLGTGTGSKITPRLIRARCWRFCSRHRSLSAAEAIGFQVQNLAKALFVAASSEKRIHCLERSPELATLLGRLAPRRDSLGGAPPVLPGSTSRARSA